MNVMLVGGGKIARGFIGHLLFKSELPFYIVEYNKEVVNLLNKEKKYTVRLLGESVYEEEISNYEALSYESIDKIVKLLATDISLVFISVGGKNLSSVGKSLREGVYARFKKGNKNPLNIILCENWIRPADVILDELCNNSDEAFCDFINTYIGITESVVMRSAIEPTVEEQKINPTLVNVQDYWYLPVDKSRIKGDLPYIRSMELLANFGSFLDQKFYTYNAANGTVSYLGNLRGHTYISDAVRDPEIRVILEGVYEETSLALCNKHSLDMRKQKEFVQTSLNKLNSKYIVDYIERNARDPLRKLGPHDRLIGPARMVLQYGGYPENLAIAIAAAIHYEQKSDAFALELKEMREKFGVKYVLENVCKLTDEDNILKELVMNKIVFLREKGLIK